MQKYNIINPINWTHHRFGWNYVINELKNKLQSSNEINFYTNGTFSRFISNYTILEKNPWMAIFHITPSDNNIIYHLKQNIVFQKNLKICRGLFVLSNYSAIFLKEYIKNTPINVLKYPMPPTFGEFCYKRFYENCEKTIFFVGHWLRNQKPFEELKSNMSKKIIYCKKEKMLKNEKYDSIFKENLIFLNLIDSSANTVILECIANNTPILVNRLPALEEYLGKDYPFFYKTIQEANSLISSFKKIEETHYYLKNLNKKDLQISSFIESLSNFKLKKYPLYL